MTTVDGNWDDIDDIDEFGTADGAQFGGFLDESTLRHLSDSDDDESLMGDDTQTKSKKSKSDSKSDSDSDSESIVNKYESESKIMRESQLFREFRSIGLVCNDVPFAYQRLGDTFFIATSIGKSFNIYQGKTLKLKIAAQSTHNKINGLIINRELTIAAVGSDIQLWSRVEHVGTITKHVGRVYLLLLIGSKFLVTVGEDNLIYIWDIARLLNRKFDIRKIIEKSPNILRKPVRTLDFSKQSYRDNEIDRITAIIHPPTYLNKVLIGFESGKLELWNINTSQRIYVFRNHLPLVTSQLNTNDLISLKSQPINLNKSDITEDTKDEPKKRSIEANITCLEASPLLDIVAVGYSNGMICIHNIKSDTQIMSFQHFNPKLHATTNNNADRTGLVGSASLVGAIQNLSFRTDGIPHLCSVGTDGNIVVWNLKHRRLQFVRHRAHHSRVITAQFLDNEPILVTSGADNALKMWIFDDSYAGGTSVGGTGMCRLLKQRCGHELPPHLVAFHGNRSLLSTANDGSLRVSWIQRDIQCLSLGQKARAKSKVKLPRIKQLHSSIHRSRFWSNVVTCHNSDNRVRLWSTKHMRLDEKMLLPQSHYSQSNATAVVISPCGNFVYVGRVSGVIDKYNLESGLHRQTYLEHNNAIRSLHVNLFNNVLISTSADTTIKFWSINSGQCRHTITDIGEAITRTCYDAKANILGVATDDCKVLIYDGSNGKLIRRFEGVIVAHVTDLLFSPLCRWILVSTMDGSVYVFDLVSALLIDWFRFNNAVTSMSFSPNNCFLATTHVNAMGIYVWANKGHFGTPLLSPVGTNAIEMDRQLKKLSSVNTDTEIIRKLLAASASDINDDDDDDSSDDDSDDDSETIAEVDPTLDVVDDNALIEDISALHLKQQSSMITTSDNPRSMWVNLANWDLILQRNKPSERVKKDVKVPFFIPTVSQPGALKMDTGATLDDMKQQKLNEESLFRGAELDKRKRILENINQKYFAPNIGDVSTDIDATTTTTTTTTTAAENIAQLSKLVALLKRAQQCDDKSEIFNDARDYLLSLPPSAADAEMRCVGLNESNARIELRLVLQFFITQMRSNRNFEHFQSYIHLFLKIHFQSLARYNGLNSYVKELATVCDKKWERINDLLQSNLCLVNFFSDIQQ